MTQFIILFLVPFIAWEIFLHRLGHAVSVIESIRIYGIMIVCNLLVTHFVIWRIAEGMKWTIKMSDIRYLLIAIGSAVLLPFVGEIFRKYSGVRVEINARKQEERSEKKGVEHLEENETPIRGQDASQDGGKPVPETAADSDVVSCAGDKQVSTAACEGDAPAEALKVVAADEPKAGNEEGEPLPAAASDAQPDEDGLQAAAPEPSEKAGPSGEADRKGDRADDGTVETNPKADASAEDETTLG